MPDQGLGIATAVIKNPSNNECGMSQSHLKRSEDSL